MRTLTLSALFFVFNPVFSQTKEVKGYVIGNSPYNCETQFKGEYFTIAKKDGYAIIKIDGSEVASGIKALISPQ